MEPSLQTVVVLIALPEEYDAVRGSLKDVRPFNHPAGTRYEVAELPVPGWRLALANAGEGNQAVAALTERSISAFAPAVVGFAGIAGALDDEFGLGDVVVADRVYATHGGREGDEGFRVRPRDWETAHQLLQLAHDVARTRSWTAPPSAGSQAPRVHFAPVADRRKWRQAAAANAAAFMVRLLPSSPPRTPPSAEAVDRPALLAMRVWGSGPSRR